MLKLGLMLLGAMIIQGCSSKEFVYADRPIEVIKTKGCVIPPITNCSIQGTTDTGVIDELEMCIHELFIVINKCKAEVNYIKDNND